MRLFINVISLFTIILFCNTSLLAQEEQLPILNKLIEGLIGIHNESNVIKFDSITGACQSEFITCDDSLRIVALNFQYSNLNGVIPNEILELEALEDINLKFNYLHGVIPEGLEKLKELKKLSLNGNFLGGSIPDTLAALSDEVAVDLSQNSFTVDDPDLISKLKIHDQIYLSDTISIDSFS